MQQVSPEHFRRLYHRKLDPRENTFRIKQDSSDPWGVIVTKNSLSGVMVWHSLSRHTVTLGFTTPEMRRLIPDAAIPDGAAAETSASGWRMFRWTVPAIDGARSPVEQPAMDEVVARIYAAFDWFRHTRTDLNPVVGS